MFESDVIAWDIVIYKSTRVNSFVEILINMVCELKITSGSKKLSKISMVIRHSIKELLAKNIVARPMEYVVIYEKYRNKLCNEFCFQDHKP